MELGDRDHLPIVVLVLLLGALPLGRPPQRRSGDRRSRDRGERRRESSGERLPPPSPPPLGVALCRRNLQK